MSRADQLWSVAPVDESETRTDSIPAALALPGMPLAPPSSRPDRVTTLNFFFSSRTSKRLNCSWIASSFELRCFRLSAGTRPESATARQHAAPNEASDGIFAEYAVPTHEADERSFRCLALLRASFGLDWRFRPCSLSFERSCVSCDPPILLVQGRTVLGDSVWR